MFYYDAPGLVEPQVLKFNIRSYRVGSISQNQEGIVAKSPISM